MIETKAFIKKLYGFLKSVEINFLSRCVSKLIGVLLMEGNSIINFSEKNNLIHPTSTRRGDKSQPGTLEHVFAIEEDSEGNVWFGDRDTGAWKYDGKTLINYSIADNLPQAMIWTIYKDNKNNLLFGMADGNIFKFNGKAFERQF